MILEERFKELCEAKETLTDVDKRAKYDQWLNSGVLIAWKDWSNFIEKSQTVWKLFHYFNNMLSIYLNLLKTSKFRVDKQWNIISFQYLSIDLIVIKYYFDMLKGVTLANKKARSNDRVSSWSSDKRRGETKQHARKLPKTKKRCWWCLIEI